MTKDTICRILFVDDEEHILGAMRRAMLDEPYECFFAGSGQAALKIIAEQKIGVIISDMRMPGMDGLTLLKEVRVISPRTVRIVLSGYTQLQQVLATINHADIFKFITKPWETDEELKPAIRAAVDYYLLQESKDELEAALKLQNVTFQNMLRRMDEIIQQSRSQSLLTGAVALSILRWRSDPLPDKHPVGTARMQIIQSISEIAVGDAHELNIEHLVEDSTGKLNELVGVTKYEWANRCDATRKIRIFEKLYQGMIVLIAQCLTSLSTDNLLRVTWWIERVKSGEFLSLSMQVVPLKEAENAIGIRLAYQNTADMMLALLQKSMNPVMVYLGGEIVGTRKDLNIVLKLSIHLD